MYYDVILLKLSHKFYIWSISAKSHQSMIQMIVLDSFTSLKNLQTRNLLNIDYRAHKKFITYCESYKGCYES